MGLIDEINQPGGYIRFEQGTDELILIFSHLNYPAGKFAMSNAMAGATASKLYINCSENSWYQVGIPGYTESITDTIKFLKKIISEINPSKTIACGMSMGGYAAILFGIKLKLDYILAFTSELTLGSKLQRSFYLNNLKKYDPDYKDISRLIVENKDTTIYLFYGAYDIIDLEGLYSIRSCIDDPKFNLNLVSGDHKATLRFDIPLMVTETLKNGKPPLNKLVLKQKLQDEDFIYYRKIQHSENDFIYHYNEFNKKKLHHSQDIFFYGKACMELKKFGEALNAFNKVISIDPDFSMSYHLAGLTLNALKRYDEAETMYESALGIDKTLATSYHRLAQTQINLKKYDEAEKNLLKSLDYNPNLADGWFLLGNLYEKKDNEAEMMKCFNMSVKLEPEQKIYTQKIKNINLNSNKTIANTHNNLNPLNYLKKLFRN